MISKSDYSSNAKPNIHTIFAHKREHLETFRDNIFATGPSTYRNLSLGEILKLISTFNELTDQVSDINKILDRSNAVSSIDKLRFQNEVYRICELNDGLTENLDQLADQICEGKKSSRIYKKLDLNFTLLHKLIDNVLGRLDLIIDQQTTLD